MIELGLNDAAGSRAKEFFRRWSAFSLAQQFAIVGSMVLVCGMLVIGSWVSREIEGAVTQNTAASSALYMDSFIAPLIQELGQKDTLSLENELALDKLWLGTDIGNRIVSVKIWKEGGKIAYSSRKAILGKVFETTPNLRRAWTGVITAEFDTLEDEEDALERSAGLPLLEIYSPIREKFTGRIIAVAEFYERAESLERDLFNAQLGSRIVVGMVTLTMIGLLSGIVLKGSRTIENQRRSLEKRVDELSILRDRLQRSSRLATELNERFLRRIGSELHDGTAQLIGLALLRLDSIGIDVLKQTSTARDERNDYEVVRGALEDSLKEIRNLSAGLVLPEFETQSLQEGILRIISIHQQRTETTIEKDIGEFPDDVNKSIKISIYRMVQEGLNNAFHHAQNAAVKVSAHFEKGVIAVDVTDKGPGFNISTDSDTGTGLGLPGLRERIESIGGSFRVRSNPGKGTSLIARFNIGNWG